MTTAVLVIDVQEAMCSGEWAAFDIDGVIERINGLTEQARAAGAPVIFIQHEDDGALAHGSEGWALASKLRTASGDVLMRKTACDSFHATGLQQMLQDRQATTLVVCGLQSEYCVDATTRRALALGYPVVLVADGHSTMDNGVLTAAQITAHHNLTLSTMSSFGPRVAAVPARDIRIAPA
jgi:nicotinamidase-related amidase